MTQILFLSNKININIKNDILIIHFKGNKNFMNQLLDPISNKYEGSIINREGHNFPSNSIPKEHLLHKYQNQCKYVIGIYHHNSLNHELLHAKFYIDNNYKQYIINEWNNLKPFVRTHIYNFLKTMGYSDNVIIDEYQAYRYSEKDNFFGIKII